MIRDLNTPIKGKEQVATNYEPIPNGTYEVEITAIDDWKEKNLKNVKVNVRDENGFPLKDEKGQPVTETIDSLTVYESKLKLKVVGGEHNGRVIFENLSTHPDAEFKLEALIFALDKGELLPGTLSFYAVGKHIMVETIQKKYNKKITDATTGLDSTEERIAVNVKKFLRLAQLSTDAALTEEDELR